MHAKVLETWVYRPDGRIDRRTKLVHPTWRQIEDAIRCLNQTSHPVLILWPTEIESEHMLDEFCERFEVCGGNDAFWMAISQDGHHQRRFVDPRGIDLDVEIYGPRIEQGFSDSERHVCRNIEVVLKATRHYAEHGGVDPSVMWEQE